MIGRYPDYDVLDATDTWDEATKRVVLARLEPPGPLGSSPSRLAQRMASGAAMDNDPAARAGRARVMTTSRR